MSVIKAKQGVSINIRAGVLQRDLIDQAAHRLGLDQTFFAVDKSTFAQFQMLLDRPLPATDKLRRLLKTRAPWE